MTLTIVFFVLGFYLKGCDGGFALSRSQEQNLISCLWLRINADDCFVTYPPRRSISESDIDLAPANEYICALSDYQNSEKTTQDAVLAVLDSGSCSHSYPSVASTWKRFLARTGDEIRIHPPISQFRNGSKVVARFTNDKFTNRQFAENLKAVDVVISRSLDDEIYGKYAVKITTRQGGSDEEVVIHNTMQATCPAERKRFFVAGLNGNGLPAVRSWLELVGRTMEFSIEITTKRRMTKSYLGHGQTTTDKDDYLGEKVVAIILHFAGSISDVVPMPGAMISPRQISRRRRSAAACHRATYVESFRNNRNIVRPVEHDIGECIGTCERALTSSANTHLNATNHALAMLWDQMKLPIPGNPDPTVCCIPISFRRFHFVIRDPNDILMVTFSDNMVAENCGCR